ncbi:MAG: NUDIX domain-containing protein [Candidatus Bathyarchaeota archaeon]|nr:NUDIX domain-containing protein [Candidatus Bathyarchaeota archaeon]MDH5733621.1 NUDIX domain-containing protein [Candidatus Bathyarchaeota archaeon]
MKERKYCTFCGKELVLKTLYDGSQEKYCDDCDHVFFHTPSPCVIVMVTNSNKVLLARGLGWKHPYWALISGHIRSGETAEETVVREVYEEVSLEVSSLDFLRTYVLEVRDLLMVAFKVETEGTSIKKSQELEEAKWFDLYHPLPLRPESTAAHVVKHVFPKMMCRGPERAGKQMHSKETMRTYFDLHK